MKDKRHFLGRLGESVVDQLKRNDIFLRQTTFITHR